MKQPLVYIVILNWNGYKDTVKCINSLEKINYKNYKILLVDNASTNESVKVLRFKFPNIQFIVNKENLGFSGGCNVGIKYALKNSAEYVLLINNDTYVDTKFLSILIEYASKDKKIGIISPFVYYSHNPKMIWSSGGYNTYRNNYPFTDDLFNSIDNGQFSNKDVENVTGCCILIKSEVFEKIGLLDEEYFLYVEDMDFSLRVINAGYKIIVTPESKVWHAVYGSTGGGYSIVTDYYNNRNFFLFAYKNLSDITRISFILFSIKGRILEILMYIKRKRFKNAAVTLKGLIHGLLGISGYQKLN